MHALDCSTSDGTSLTAPRRISMVPGETRTPIIRSLATSGSRSDGAKSEHTAPGVQSTEIERTALEDCLQGFFGDAVRSKTIVCTRVRRVLAEVLQRAPKVLDEITHRDTLSMS